MSVVLKITRHPRSFGNSSGYEEEDCTDEDGYGPVLFPLLDKNDTNNHNVQVTSGNANSNKRSESYREVALINPHAFEKDAECNTTGDRKRIVGKVTVETARLVAEVVSLVFIFDSVVSSLDAHLHSLSIAHLLMDLTVTFDQSQISSEDWARKYQYNEILWPSSNPSISTQNHNISLRSAQLQLVCMY